MAGGDLGGRGGPCGCDGKGRRRARRGAAGEHDRLLPEHQHAPGSQAHDREEVKLASEVGYDALEPWIRELDDHVKTGGSLEALGKEIRDRNLSVESAIGFFEWAVDDDGRRQKAFDEAKRNFEMVRALGGKRLAAPPVGLTGTTGVDLLRVAERYRALIDMGDTFGVVPEVELWGGSKTLSRLGEAALVAIESGHPRACILPTSITCTKEARAFRDCRCSTPRRSTSST